MAPVDDLEIWFDKGVTDGLPVIPPSRARVERMLAASARARDHLVGEVAPNYGRATVEKIAINAVMAGCRPEYFPVVLAAVEAACDPSFNLHGVSTMINVGGVRPGETSMSTFGHPGRYTYCIGEHEEVSPWPPYHAGRGLTAADSAVTVFAGEAPHGISDHASRTARALAGSLGWSMASLWNAKHFPLYSHTMLVVGPEHARTLADDGWSKDDLVRHIFETVRMPYGRLKPDEDSGEGTNLRFAKGGEPAADQPIPKFPSPEELHVVVAGGTAGRFSMAIPGWLGTKNGSRPVTVAIRDTP